MHLVRVWLAGTLAALFVPMAVAGEVVSGYTEVPVPVTMIYAGQPIDPGALTGLRVANRYLARAHFALDPSELEGKLARSTLVPGRPIPVTQVREPDVIRTSKPVKVVYRAGMLLIIGEAVPLASATKGEIVRARSLDSGVVITGVAQADGTLLVVR